MSPGCTASSRCHCQSQQRCTNACQSVVLGYAQEWVRQTWTFECRGWSPVQQQQTVGPQEYSQTSQPVINTSNITSNGTWGIEHYCVVTIATASAVGEGDTVIQPSLISSTILLQFIKPPVLILGNTSVVIVYLRESLATTIQQKIWVGETWVNMAIP